MLNKKRLFYEGFSSLMILIIQNCKLNLFKFKYTTIHIPVKLKEKKYHRKSVLLCEFAYIFEEITTVLFIQYTPKLSNYHSIC